jgi:anti-sigma B factor antagonist
MSELFEGHAVANVDSQGIKPPPAYAIEDRSGSPGVAVLALLGDLDMSATRALRGRIEEAAAGDALVLDLSAVTFIDSAILKELLRARIELDIRGVRVVLAGVPEPVRRLLDLTRTYELFEPAPDAATALRRLGA